MTRLRLPAQEADPGYTRLTNALLRLNVVDNEPDPENDGSFHLSARSEDRMK